MSFFEGPGGVIVEAGRYTPHTQGRGRNLARDVVLGDHYRWCSTGGKTAHIQHEEDDRTLCDKRTIWPEPASYQERVQRKGYAPVCPRCESDMAAELRGEWT